MIGVAIRNEKCAASPCCRPANSPPTIAAPEREMPGMNAAHCHAPIASAPRQPSGVEAVPTAALRCPVAHAVADQQQKAVDDQEQGSDEGRRKEAAHELFQRETNHHGGQRGDDDEAEEPPRLRRRPVAASAKAGEARRDEQPVAPEIH